MSGDRSLRAAASLFKVLGSESRLAIVRILAESPSTVGSLVEATGLSQPLVSQHLRTLRLEGIVDFERSGREAVYRLADHHIAHVIEDAVAHVLEERPVATPEENTS